MERCRRYRGDSLPAIGVVFLENGSVHVFHFNEDGFVGKTEFFEDDGNFPRIGAGSMVEESDFLSHDGGCGRLLGVVVDVLKEGLWDVVERERERKGKARQDICSE